MESWILTFYTAIVTLPTSILLDGSTVEVNTRHFQKILSPTAGPARLNSGWNQESLLACASACLNSYSNCYSFMYNKNTGLCTPGSELNPTEATPNSAEGLLYSYQSNECGPHQDYTLFTVGDISSCVYFSPDYTTYELASQHCTSKGGHLMTTNNTERVDFLSEFAASNGVTYAVWIGLNDLDQEGVFVWTETGTTLDDQSKLALFDNGQPDNDNNNEDCVALLMGPRKFNDVPCSGMQAVVCELNS